MKLEDAFKLFGNGVTLKRKSKPWISGEVAWLKGLEKWGTESNRKLGFFIPNEMIEDANANDWEYDGDPTESKSNRKTAKL